MGSKGGYRIARPATQISLAEIIDAIEGPFRLALCCGEATEAPNDSCDLSEACHIREPLRRVNTGLRNYLTQVSLAQITFGDAPIDLKVARRNGDRKAATVE